LPTADVAVIGGGIIGTTAALELQRRGHDVTVIEPNEVGAGTAGGSAGYLAWNDIFPIPNPRVIAGLPRMLLDKRGPLVIKPSYLPHMMGWGLRFLLAARPSAVKSAIAALAQLNRLAEESLFDLARYAGADRYLVHETVFHVCRDEKTLEHVATLQPLLAAEGFRTELLDREAVRAAEPALTGSVAGALAHPGSGRCSSPPQFGRRLAETFRTRSGGIITARADAIERAGNAWRVRTSAGVDIEAAAIVVANGAWSGAILRTIGYRVPMQSARGYHLMIPHAGVMPTRTLNFEPEHFCATPMDEGLRLAGTVEFAGTQAPLNPYRADMLYDIARDYLPALQRDGAARWMGHRPSLPDSLPIISTLRRARGIVAAIGHERRGLTESAITARCVADLVEGKTPPIDLAPFSIERF
jgi:glycine/D-amino acid oxidase-like deaminating enzyme